MCDQFTPTWTNRRQLKVTMSYTIGLCCILLSGALSAQYSAVGARSADNMPTRRDFASEPRRDDTVLPGRAAPVQIADADEPPAGVRIVTAQPTPVLNWGEAIVNTIDVYNSVASQNTSC
jgi:hypothetical protein